MDEDEIKNAKTRASSGKGKFTRIYNRFLDGMTKKEDVAILKMMLGELEVAYRSAEEKLEWYLEMLDPDDEALKQARDDCTASTAKLYDELCNARLLHREMETQGAQKEERKPIVTPIKVKKLDAPCFSGEISDYSSFKRDYATHMIPAYGKDPYALRKCLTGEALQTVQAVDDDFDEMMERLDTKYGRPERVLDSILSRIRKIKPVAEGDMIKFIEMIETVEGCWLELKKLDLEEEFSTVTMISYVEKLLPSLQLREWAILKNQKGLHRGKDQFKYFIEYLVQQKVAMEYMLGDIRRSSRATDMKYKVNNVEADVVTDDDSASLSSIVKSQMDQQSEILKSLAEGVAQMVQVLSNTGEGRLQKNVNTWVTYKKCWLHDSDGHPVTDCSAFKSLTLQERSRRVRIKRACFRCLKQGHTAQNCFNKTPCEILDSKNQKCGKMHHNLLHEVSLEASSSLCFDITNATGRPSILPIGKVRCLGQVLKTLWDSGANISLIARNVAKSLGLKGNKVSLKLTKAGNVTEAIDSVEYKIPLVDNENNTWWINVYEIREIMSDDSVYDLKEICKVFPEITEADIAKAEGNVDLLIGTDCATLLPIRINQVGQLQLLKNQFGFGLCGTHQSVRNVNLSSNLILRAICSQVREQRNRDFLGDIMQEFLSIESLGTDCPLKCGDCKCGKCILQDRGNKELKIIEEGLYLDPEKQEWTVSYPKVQDYKNLPNNYIYAEKRLVQLERKLLKAGRSYANRYEEQIQDMFARGVARKLSEEQINGYKGPVHYVPHHEIVKASSESTPMRVVFDPSIGFMGHVLNDYWLKGPSLINNLFVILMRFRLDYVALVGDISKMYNSVNLSIEDQHVHRFLWRDFDVSIQPKQYVLTKVPFGDRPSGAVSIAAMRKTADLCKDQYPETVDYIKKDSYVDDLVGSFSTFEVALKRMRETEEILGKGGFNIKEWIMTGSERAITDAPKLIRRDKQKVLGMIWLPDKDVFVYQICFDFDRKNKKPDGRAVARDDVMSAVPVLLTPRMILSQIATIYDPLGLIVPITLEAKMVMRKICCSSECSKHKKRWDGVVPEELRCLCISMFQHILEVEALQFRRCVRPEICMNEPTLLIFSDGSELAYGCCVYLRWLTGDMTYDANLLVAKNRIAPSRKLTVPRLELCGALLGARIRSQLVQELSCKFSAIYHLIDSTIVRAQIQKESYGFCSFVATRLGEIQSKTDVSEWWWIPSQFNPADMTTRITPADKIGSDSMWQKGPTFLTKPVGDWCIEKPCVTEELPDRSKITLTSDARLVKSKPTKPVISLNVIEMKNFNSYNKLLSVTSMLLNIAQSRSFRNCAAISVEGIREAEEAWIRFVQTEIRMEDWRVRYRRLAPEMNEAGIIIVGTRMKKWIKNNWNQDYFILLPYNNEFTRLYVKLIHEVDHPGIEVTLSKIRLRFWIPKCRKIIHSIKAKCVPCRKKYLEIIGQQMGCLPEDRLRPSPPFSYVAVDLFGPFTIRDAVKKRCHGKAFGVVFTDICNKACHVELAESYDTNSFINVLRRFVSIRGYPNLMRSDLGSQLVAARKELKSIVDQWNWDVIYQFGVHEGMQWEMTKSADAPWENGCCEAAVKLVKTCLKDAIGNHILTFSELLTVLYEAGNLINERPIGTKTTDPNEGSYLSPNDLLLGRSSNHAPACWMEAVPDPRKRWQFLQTLVNTFWRRWQRDYFHTLILRARWHTAKRNLQERDIVLVKDSKALRGVWKLAQVTSAQPGSDGLVRDVTLRYKSQSPEREYKGLQDISISRSVHKLVLLLPTEEQ